MSIPGKSDGKTYKVESPNQTGWGLREKIMEFIRRLLCPWNLSQSYWNSSHFTKSWAWLVLAQELQVSVHKVNRCWSNRHCCILSSNFLKKCFYFPQTKYLWSVSLALQYLHRMYNVQEDSFAFFPCGI